MELHSSRIWFLIMAIGLVFLTYIIGLSPASSGNHYLEIQSRNGEPSPAVMAAGYAGLGEGWGLQATRSLLQLYGTAGVCAMELPALLGSVPVQAAPLPDPDPPVAPVAAPGKAVLIYCTHGTESYISDEGAPRTEGRPGLIFEVARTLGDELEQQGYAVTVSEELHDWPKFTASYSQSRRTVQDFLKLHPDAAAIIDVHRDAFPDGGAITSKVDGKEVAPVLLIVGTDKRQPHPNWQDNLAFGNQLNDTAQKMYPGLIRGVRPKAGVYNQDLSKRAMLIEFGTDGNTLEQARSSAQLMGKVLGRVIGSDE